MVNSPPLAACRRGTVVEMRPRNDDHLAWSRHMVILMLGCRSSRSFDGFGEGAIEG
jgi:hypothetical protein